MILVVGLLRLELFMSGVGSLKEKRRIIKSIVGRIEAKFRVSIAEVDHQDRWQRATLAVAYVSETGGQARKALENVAVFVESLNKALVTEREVSLFSPE